MIARCWLCPWGGRPGTEIEEFPRGSRSAPRIERK